MFGPYLPAIEAGGWGVRGVSLVYVRNRAGYAEPPDQLYSQMQVKDPFFLSCVHSLSWESKYWSQKSSFSYLHILIFLLFIDSVVPKWGDLQVAPCPGWCGSDDWAPACEPEVCRFHSWPGHMPGLPARCSVGSVWEATDGCLSHTFSLLPPLSKNK